MVTRIVKEIVVMLLTVITVLTLMSIVVFFGGYETLIRGILGEIYPYVIFTIVSLAIAYVLFRRRKRSPIQPSTPKETPTQEEIPRDETQPQPTLQEQPTQVGQKNRLTLRLDEKELSFKNNKEARTTGTIAKIGPGSIRDFSLEVNPLDIPLRMKIKWNGDEDSIDDTHHHSSIRTTNLTSGEERPVSFVVYNPKRPGTKFNIFFKITTKEPLITYELEDFIHVVCRKASDITASKVSTGGKSRLKKPRNGLPGKDNQSNA